MAFTHYLKMNDALSDVYEYFNEKIKNTGKEYFFCPFTILMSPVSTNSKKKK